MTNTKFKTQERSNQNASFVNGKKHTPPETKTVPNSTKDANSPSNKRQTQPKTLTPPEVENTRFHQLSLDKAQDKLRPFIQQSKSMLM
jgi:hypothetical protein